MAYVQPIYVDTDACIKPENELIFVCVGIQYDENDPQTGENEETGYTSSSSSDTVDINTVLAGPSGVNPDNEIYVCDEPKCEPFHQEEETHQVVQQSQKKHECADCGQSFETTTILKKHMKCHAQIKEPFRCSLCNKT